MVPSINARQFLIEAAGVKLSSGGLLFRDERGLECSSADAAGKNVSFVT